MSTNDKIPKTPQTPQPSKPKHERNNSYFTSDDKSNSSELETSPISSRQSSDNFPKMTRVQSETSMSNLRRGSLSETPKQPSTPGLKTQGSMSSLPIKSPQKKERIGGASGSSSRQDRKKMLSSFYGEIENAPTTTTNIGTPMPPRISISLSEDDMDTPHFNSERYVKSLLSKNDLNSLIEKDQKLCEETRSLDNEMQKLVYKNYNKFIIATETIKDMKESVGNMEGKMKLLAKSIDEITETSTIINNNLATKREKIENLSGINRMLKKLQFLLVLPSRLTDCLALKSYAIAVRDYLRAEKILKQYRHLPSFHSIEIECSEIMTKLKTTLHESVKVHNIPRQTLKTHHQLLFQLGESPEFLLKQFLAFREKDLTNRLGEFKHQKNKDLRTNLQDLNKNFVKTYQAHYELYKHVFEVPDVSPEVKLKPILGEFTSKMFTNYFQVLRDLFLNKFTPEIIPTNLNFKEGVSNEKEKKKVEKSLENLRDIMVSLSTEISLVDEKVPSAKISTLLSSFLFDYLYSFLNLNLIQFKQDVSNSLDFYTHLSRKEELNINLTATSFSKNIENDLIDIISELNHFYDLKISSLNQKNLSILVDKTVEILDYLKEYLVSNSSKKSEIRLSSVDERITTTPNGALLLCKFATEMENVTSKSIIDRISVFDTSARAKFTSKFGEASSKMLVYYIEKQSDVLSELIVDGLNAIDWKNLSSAPIGVSKVVVNYAEEILHVNKDISVIFQDDSDDEKTDSYSEGSSAFQYKKSGFGFDDNSGITKDVLKIFNQRLTRLAIVQPEFKRNYVLNEIVKRTLKSFDEAVRYLTFSKYGYQQIQVDTNYLQNKLRDVLDDENFLRNLLKDIFGCVEDRCLAVESLNHETVVKLFSKEK